MRKTPLFILLFIVVVSISCEKKSEALNTEFLKQKDARFFFKDKNSGFYGLLDKSGKVVASANFKYVGLLKDDMIQVYMKNNMIRFVDTKGAFLTEKFFYNVGRMFSENMLPVKVSKSGKCGFVDKSFEYAIKPKFEDVGLFKKGIAPARKDGLWGIINKKGIFTVPPKYNNGKDLLRYFNNDEEVSEKIRKTPSNKIKIKNESVKLEENKKKYEEVRESLCENHSISYKYKGLWGYLSREGEIAIPAKYEKVQAFYKNRAVVMKNGRKIVIDRKGEELFEIKVSWEDFGELEYVEPICKGWTLMSIQDQDYWLTREQIEEKLSK